MSYSEEYEVSPGRDTNFFNEALNAAMKTGSGREYLSPKLALKVIEEASLPALKEEGWGCTWMVLSALLPPEPQPGGSWRLRGARAAAARDPSFGSEFGLQTRRDGTSWTGNFIKPWAVAGLPHLAEFEAGERVEFLRLIPEELRARSEGAWREEAAKVRQRMEALEAALEEARA
jgi:hypothetical protein